MAILCYHIVMSQKRQKRDAVEAYFTGLRTGGDPEVLADLGIPTSPEKFYSNTESGHEVYRRLQIQKGMGELAVFCADCLDDIQPGSSCSHLSVGVGGVIRVIG